MLPKTRKIKRDEGRRQKEVSEEPRYTADGKALQGKAKDLGFTPRKESVWAGVRKYPGSGLAPQNGVGRKRKRYSDTLSLKKPGSKAGVAKGH